MDATRKLIKNEAKRGWSRDKRPVRYFGPKKKTGAKKPKARKKESAKDKDGKRRKKRKSIAVLGVIGSNQEYCFDFYDAGNWLNVKDFLLKVHARFGKALTFMDNAPYHIKSEIEKLTRGTNGDLQFEFYLKYTPELNPVETQWREFKSKLAGMPAKTVADMKSLLTNGIKNKVLPIVKMYDYLTP